MLHCLENAIVNAETTFCAKDQRCFELVILAACLAYAQLISFLKTMGKCTSNAGQ
jgi:hypothetical protein